MDKNKRIGLVVLLVLGIGLCTWSIYNSIVTMSQSDDNPTTEITGNNSSSQGKSNSGTPVIIDDSKSNDTTSDSDIEKNKDEDSTSETSSNVNTGTNYSEKYITYTVEENETLKDICEKYSNNCPVSLLSKAILLSNNLKSSKDIKEGMTIKIPEKYTLNGIKYTVKSGDSISSIVTKYMNELDYAEAIEMLKRDNYLTTDNIRIGDVLFVSVSDLSLVSAETDEEVDEDEVDESGNIESDREDSVPTVSSFIGRIGEVSTYIVKKNDSLASISKQYSESCPQKSAANIILKLNNLSKSSDIKEGMEIKLPDKYLSEGVIYTVKVGDTLSSIASQNLEDVDWYTAVSIISQDNDIKNDTIFAGQELFIASIDN